jgi:very-short-patch-repair endonuclease
MARDLHVAIAERAGQQLGLLTRPQLRELGVTPDQVRRLRQSGLLIPRGRQVLRHCGFPDTHDSRLLAAAWAAGAGAVVSHLAAAGFWGFDGISRGAVEVTVPVPRQPRAVPGLVHRARDLLPVDVTSRGLLPLTTPSRTLLDSAPRLQETQLEEALDGACRRGQIHVPYLAWRLAALRKSGRPGVAKIETLLRSARAERGEETWLESAFLRILRDAGLPPPRIQMTVVPGQGGRRYRLDGCYEEQRLVVEVDGHGTHATRRQRQADAERDMRLVAAGYRVVRFTYEDVTERPDHVAATIAMLLGLDVAV